MSSSLNLAGLPLLWSTQHKKAKELIKISPPKIGVKSWNTRNIIVMIIKIKYIHTLLCLPRSQPSSVAPWDPGLVHSQGSAVGRCSPGAEGSTESPSGQSWTPQHNCGRLCVEKGPGPSECPCWPGKRQPAPRHSLKRTTPPPHPQSPKQRKQVMGKKSYETTIYAWLILKLHKVPPSEIH